MQKPRFVRRALLASFALLAAPASHCGGGSIPPSAYPPGSPGTGALRVRATAEVAPVSDIGAFRVSCAYSHMNTDDPIVYPNRPGAAHLHTFFGNTGSNAASTHATLRSSGNSTCRGGTANRSAYWVPTLIRGGHTPVAPTDAIFYYKSGYAIPDVSALIQKIPAGLMMIAGDMKASEPQSGGVAYWGCAEVYKGHFPHIVDCDVGDSIQLSVHFPQCWNGRDLDSSDHKSHMAYPVNGACPGTHPVPLPEISLHVRWQRTPDMNVAELRLSSDHYSDSKPGGYSAHGDWLEAWDPGIRDAFVVNCLNRSRDCHAHLLGDGREIY